MISLTDKILFNPKTNSVLSTMDDSRSAIALATTDFIGSSGRTYMEYKRDTHGGRERLYEEFLTWIIWGFGIKTAKSLYDKTMKSKLFGEKFGIDFPSMDVDLLPPASGKAAVKSVQKPKWNQNFGAWFQSKIFPEVTQTLDPARVEEFRKYTTNLEYKEKYKKLLDVVSAPEKFNQKYYRSNLAKFSIATLAPVLLIGLGIPTLNQWITRKKFEDQKTKQTPAKTMPGPTPRAHANAFGGFAYRAGQMNPMQQTLNHPTASPFNAPFPANAGMPFNLPHQSNAGQFGFQPATSPISPALQSPFQQQAAMWPQQPRFSGQQKNSQVQFGSLSSAVQKMASGSSLFLQNDQWNTLLVDNTITAGRLYKGRNTLERVEILFRELSIIGFLYFARKPIQNAIGNMVRKVVSGGVKIPVEMEFKTIKSLMDNKGLLKNFKEHWAPLEFKNDQEIVKAIQDEFLGAPSKNPIFEMAKEIGWIPTMDAKKEFLDLTQKIDIDSIKTMAQSVKALSSEAKNDAGKLETLLKKAMQIRATAWALSNAACFAYLSWLVPKIQHEITRQKTGKDFFPGTQGYEAQGAH